MYKKEVSPAQRAAQRAYAIRASIYKQAAKVQAGTKGVAAEVAAEVVTAKAKAKAKADTAEAKAASMPCLTGTRAEALAAILAAVSAGRLSAYKAKELSHLVTAYHKALAKGG